MMSRWISCFWLLVLISVAQVVANDDLPADANFVRHVLPTLQTKCFSCHGDEADQLRGELNIKSIDGLLRGGESGEPAVIAGKPAESLLFLAVTRKSDLVGAMPPKENDALSSAQIAALKHWIESGANWPSESQIAMIRAEYQERWNAADGLAVVTSGGLSAEWTHRRYKPENLWAYQPLWEDSDGWLKPEIGHVIDQLVNRRLTAMGLAPAKRADRRTLIRRATYDLLGLPPSTAEIADFEKDPADDQTAFLKVIDRLLASPHYGEQWARHWLDVVRYADSSGFANDYERGNAWRYRDYVVRAFNDDKPYDQFILEQIAGDELAPENPEHLIAVGFLRMGPWELTGMEVAKIARQRFLDDVTDIVGQTFLGHMLQCARCHDHKFDPVPTRDYYSIQAAFATTQLAERAVPFLDVENQSGFEELKYLDERRIHYEQTLEELSKKQTIAAAREWYRQEQKSAEVFDSTLRQLATTKNMAEDQISVSEVRKEMQQAKVDPSLIPPRHVGFAPVDFGMERVARKGLERLKWREERYEPYALSVYNGRTVHRRSVNAPVRVPDNPRGMGELEGSFILTGGDPFSPSVPVTPGVLSAVALSSTRQSSSDAEPDPGVNFDRRLDLARWIASKDNPLTARVMVNRIWQWHFNQPIAGNPNNFGATGKRPTHPELLDELSRLFMQSGWSVKAMHRLMMHSDAYCRATQHAQPQQLEKLDPLREAYAVFLPRRLDAEELRDSMLAVSGELNPTMGGIPVRPEINLEAALQPRQVMGTFAEAWQPSPHPEQRHRRTLYSLKIRGQSDPFLDVFNAPGSDLSCERREASTVTPQAFAMFNNEQIYTRGLFLAHNLLKIVPSQSSREVIAVLFQQVLGRLPTSSETTACIAHWEKMTQRHESLEIPCRSCPNEVLREAMEENTGEKFTFVEPLEVYRDFVPDLEPCAVDARTRGLAEVCLVLFNSHEFAYVY